MKILYAIIFFLVGVTVYSQVPNNYYSPANGLMGFALKTKLKEIIDDEDNGLSTEFLHLDQGDNLDALYQNSDIDLYYENDGTILDIYSENPSGVDPYNYTYASDECAGNFSMEGECYNKEHTIPRSIYGEASPMVNDAHHVIPTDGRVNGLRGSFPFGVVDDTQLISQGGVNNPTQNGSKAGGNLDSGYSSGYTGTVFEPIDEFKGDLARIYFYFVTRYETQVSAWSSYDMFDGSNNQAIEDTFLNILINWHLSDPVSQKEIDRNNAVFNYQNNRNPFVDNPDYVSQIWNITQDSQAPSIPTDLVANNPTDNTIDLSWTASTDNVAVTSYDIYINSVFSSTFLNTSVTITGLIPDTNYCFLVKAKDASGNESTFSNEACETTTNTGTTSDCVFEDFTAIPDNNSQYTTRSWSSENGIWTAEAARTDQNINERAILIDYRDNDDIGVLTSPVVFGGIGDLTVTTQRIFSGTNGTLDISVNGANVGFIPYGDVPQTVTIQGINIEGDIQVQVRDNNSGSARVGIDDLSWTCFSSLTTDEFKANKFKLYPNPTTTGFTIQGKSFKEKVQLTIYNLSGKTVLKRFVSVNQEIDISKLVVGLYLVKLKVNNTSIIKRLLKH